MSGARTALLVGSAPIGPDFKHYAGLICTADLLIAADGGVRVCLDAGRVPDVCVGDFDSTDAATLLEAESSGAEIRRFPVAKDVSDLDLSLAVARELGAREVTFTAAFSGRLDHTLAALGTLFSAVDLYAIADEPLWRAHALRADSRREIYLDEPAGTVISVIAVGGAATVSIAGVEYPLEGGQLAGMSSLGLSNVAATKPQCITLLGGSALVIVNKPAHTSPTVGDGGGR